MSRDRVQHREKHVVPTTGQVLNIVLTRIRNLLIFIASHTSGIMQTVKEFAKQFHIVSMLVSLQIG